MRPTVLNSFHSRLITNLPVTTQSNPPCLHVGIDWADAEHAYAEHAYAMRDPNGKLHRGTFRQTPEAIAAIIENWEKLFPGASIVVCIETKRGLSMRLNMPRKKKNPVAQASSFFTGSDGNLKRFEIPMFGRVTARRLNRASDKSQRLRILKHEP